MNEKSCHFFIFSLFATASLSSGYMVLISSSQCRTGCLDVPNRFYCPTADMKIGYCCSAYEQCPKEFRFCSPELGVSYTLQKFICPFESFCGSSTFNLTATEDPKTLQVANNTKVGGVFTNNSFCQYTFQAPRPMRVNEQI